VCEIGRSVTSGPSHVVAVFPSALVSSSQLALLVLVLHTELHARVQKVSVPQMSFYSPSHCLCRFTSSSTISSSISFSGSFSKSMRIHDSPNWGTEGSVLCVL